MKARRVGTKLLPYITHPIAVAEAVEARCKDAGMPEDEIDIYKAAAVLHDAVEDTEATLEQVLEAFGSRVWIAVDCLTRREYEEGRKEPYVEFVIRCRRNTIAALVKFEDIRHNLTDLKTGSMRDKYELALEILKGNSLLDLIF